jgi:hypothetical protein
VLIRWRTVRSLTRTVRHRSPMRLRQRCACTRLAAAALKRVTFAGSSLGNALPPLDTASLVQGRPGGKPPCPKAPRRLSRSQALHGRRRVASVRSVCTHKGFRLGPASITTATSLAVHSAERGEGGDIIIFRVHLGGCSLGTQADLSQFAVPVERKAGDTFSPAANTSACNALGEGAP